MNELNSFLEAFQGLLDIPDDELNDDMMKALLENLNQNFAPEIINQSINQVIQNLEDQNLDKVNAQASVSALKEVIQDSIYSDREYTGNKKILVDTILNKIFDIFDTAIEKYHSYAIELPIQLEDGAQVPTYAHDSDAAADLYAMEDIEIPAHFLSVPVKTGVHIQLPEGWVAMILPRSSIGAKTSLRLSNSQGVIDSGYRGEVRALYDNVGTESYTIHKGDRIAQMYIMPSYRFKARVVDSLEDSDRGEAGFGSTGV